MKTIKIDEIVSLPPQTEVEFVAYIADVHYLEGPKYDGTLWTMARVGLRDRTGSTVLPMFGSTKQDAAIMQENKFIRIQGYTEVYKKTDEMQVKMMTYEFLSVDEVDPNDFVTVAPKPIEYLTSMLDALIKSVREPNLRAILDATIGLDGCYRKPFCAAQGALKRHHSYRHGLLMHTLHVARIAMHAVDDHRIFDTGRLFQDLLVTGALLHDIGKLEEYEEVDLCCSVTARGRMFGHLLLGSDMISKVARELGGIPQDLLDQLLHIIVSHHGKLEYGAIALPITVEAIAVHRADQVSSQDEDFRVAVSLAVPDSDGFAYSPKLDSVWGRSGMNIFVDMPKLQAKYEVTG